jgi:hypothetical protein
VGHVWRKREESKGMRDDGKCMRTLLLWRGREEATCDVNVEVGSGMHAQHK